MSIIIPSDIPLSLQRALKELDDKIDRLAARKSEVSQQDLEDIRESSTAEIKQALARPTHLDFRDVFRGSDEHALGYVPDPAAEFPEGQHYLGSDGFWTPLLDGYVRLAEPGRGGRSLAQAVVEVHGSLAVTGAIQGENVLSRNAQVTRAITLNGSDVETAIAAKLPLAGGTMTGDLTLSSATSLHPYLTLVNTNADSLNPSVFMRKESASPTANDYLGGLTFQGYNDNVNPETINYASIAAQSTVLTDGSESGVLDLYAMSGGSNVLHATLGSGVTTIYGRLDAAMVGVRAFNTANIAANTGTTLVTLNNESFDTNNFHSADTNTGRLTVPAGLAGYYYVTGHVRWDATTTAANYRTIRLERNSAGTATVANIFAQTRLMANTDNVVFDHICHGIIHLDATDYVEMFVGTGENTNVIFADVHYDTPSLSMFRIGT